MICATCYYIVIIHISDLIATCENYSVQFLAFVFIKCRCCLVKALKHDRRKCNLIKSNLGKEVKFQINWHRLYGILWA